MYNYLFLNETPKIETLSFWAYLLHSVLKDMPVISFVVSYLFM
jgi:hypothetical protein